jgi:hypothetical protein
MTSLKNLVFFISTILILNSCGGKLPGADAKKYPPNPKERVKNNLEQGRGFRLDTMTKSKGGKFDFASSNELWRATLDIIDFMPLTSANYSGGIIITDWYSKNQSDEAIKITIRFLSNEVRSDALDIKIFYKKCNSDSQCSVTEKRGEINKELKKEILKAAAVYSEQTKDKNFKPIDSSFLRTDQ